MTSGDRFEARVRARLGPDRLRAKVPLAPLTTFRVGGPAEWFADIETVDELREVLAAASEAGVPVSLLGGGSNVLVADAGVPGLVIRPRLASIAQTAGDTVRAESGVTINGLVRWTIGRGFAGLEAWAGTPGSIGGAVYGNAHWGGRNIGDLVRRVLVASTGGHLQEVPQAEMGFAYDTSRLQRTREIVVWAEFGVSQGTVSALREQARASLHYRKRTQPLAMPSAGCVFQNPDARVDRLPEGVPASAGALVDRAGLKGHRIGGARISDTHANFIVNEGHATAADVRALITAARAAVADRFGVLLRDEIVYLGTFLNG
jgi:UDP-N-acetylmuramate dehydrogenase